MQLDQSGSCPVSAQFKDAPSLKVARRMRTSEALENFRGTLIDGVLQPNVRLGNGLCLSNKPGILKPRLQEKRRKWDCEPGALRESVGLPNRTPAKLLDQSGARPPRDSRLPSKLDSPVPARQQHFQHREAPTARKNLSPRQHSLPPISDDPSSAHKQDVERREAYVARRESDLEAKERELELRNEVSRWKRKTWLLEQKLIMVTGGRPQTLRERDQIDGNVLQDEPKNTPKFSYQQEALPSPQVENTGDEFYSDAFDLNAPSPPKALAALRSRTQLPKRRVRHSK